MTFDNYAIDNPCGGICDEIDDWDEGRLDADCPCDVCEYQDYLERAP